MELLQTLQVVLLAGSYLCLLTFGAVILQPKWSGGLKLVAVIAALWGMFFWTSLSLIPNFEMWRRTGVISVRYMIALPGGLIAAYGLRFQAEKFIKPLGAHRIYQALQWAGFALIAYGVFGGIFVPPERFFPANVINGAMFEQWTFGIPVEVFRSLAGLVLTLAMIRALGIFDLEVDRLIEKMEVEQIQDAERERIGQEIHDGAIQSVYSASLILESMTAHLVEGSEAAIRLERTKRVLTSAINDLRRYMVSLRTNAPTNSLASELRLLADDPRFSSLIQVQLNIETEPELKPMQVGHLIAIVQEAFSNAIRHAKARHITVSLGKDAEGIIMRIVDDGKGFDEGTITPGYGLRSIRDRARLSGAKLTIESKAGKGTAISLRIAEETNS